MDNKLITPRKLAGFMELEPQKQIVFDNMLAKIRKVYEKNSFLPLDTPILELSEVLLAKSGGEIDKEVYHFTKGSTDICMRYDLTVPLARFVSMNFDKLNFPYRRFQMGKVFRGEKPQRGRFREIYQCDIDIIGNENLPICADSECIKVGYEIFEELNFEPIIELSNRNILFGYIEDIGFVEKRNDILTALDKIDKIGVENLKEMLLEIGVDKENTTKLVELTSLCGPFDTIIEKIQNLSTNEIYVKDVNELKELNSYLKAMQIPEDSYVLKLGVIRGQNYYTGTVIEIRLKGYENLGVVCGGGRYDNLASYFTNKHLPGVGISIGLTRIFDILDYQNLLDLNFSPIDLMIIPLGDTKANCMELLFYFRKNNITCEVAYEDKSFKSKLKDANKRNIPYILIVGEDEVKNNAYAFKNMASSQQETLTKEEILNKLK